MNVSERNGTKRSDVVTVLRFVWDSSHLTTFARLLLLGTKELTINNLNPGFENQENGHCPVTTHHSPSSYCFHSLLTFTSVFFTPGNLHPWFVSTAYVHPLNSFMLSLTHSLRERSEWMSEWTEQMARSRGRATEVMRIKDVVNCWSEITDRLDHKWSWKMIISSL